MYITKNKIKKKKILSKKKYPNSSSEFSFFSLSLSNFLKTYH